MMKLQTPSTKLQRTSKSAGKLQIPSSKSQRSSKSQAPNVNGRDRDRFGYTDDKRGPRLNEASNGNNAVGRPFELEERTAQFGEAIVRFAKKIQRDPANDRLIGQLVGCGTSVGANYCEADERVSKKDFRNTIGRCVKEAKETKYFLRMIAAAEPRLAAEARELFREAKELHLIFASIYRK
jgi:four helix bundle protein